MNPPHQFLQLSLSCPCSPDPAPSSVPPAWPIPSSLLQQTHEVSEDSPHRHLGFFLLLRRKLLQGQGWEHFGPLGWTQQLMRYLKGNDRLQVQVCHIQKGWKKHGLFRVPGWGVMSASDGLCTGLCAGLACEAGGGDTAALGSRSAVTSPSGVSSHFAGAAVTSMAAS